MQDAHTEIMQPVGARISVGYYLIHGCEIETSWEDEPVGGDEGWDAHDEDGYLLAVRADGFPA